MRADILGKIISVEGEVEGNLHGEDKIIIRQSGTVHGDLVAPCINLEEGCKFRGTVDMEAGNSDRRGTPTLLQRANEYFRKLFG